MRNSRGLIRMYSNCFFLPKLQHMLSGGASDEALKLQSPLSPLCCHLTSYNASSTWNKWKKQWLFSQVFLTRTKGNVTKFHGHIKILLNKTKPILNWTWRSFDENFTLAETPLKSRRLQQHTIRIEFQFLPPWVVYKLQIKTKTDLCNTTSC